MTQVLIKHDLIMICIGHSCYIRRISAIRGQANFGLRPMKTLCTTPSYNRNVGVFPYASRHLVILNVYDYTMKIKNEKQKTKKMLAPLEVGIEPTIYLNNSSGRSSNESAL